MLHWERRSLRGTQMGYAKGYSWPDRKHADTCYLELKNGKNSRVTVAVPRASSKASWGRKLKRPLNTDSRATAANPTQVGCRCRVEGDH